MHYSRIVSAGFLPTFLLALAITGCSSGSSVPTVPGEPPDLTAAAESVGVELGEGSLHYPLGFFACTADPEAGTLEIVPLRGVELHINALFYLQGGPEKLLTIEGAPVFSDGGKRLDVGIGIRHPMDDPVWTGFDVRAILMSEGDVDGWADPTVILAGPDQTRLINSDGYTRWWNPREFQNNGLYGYIPGILGHLLLPYSTAVLNGYKYYADGLGPHDDMAALDTARRGMFTAGAKLVRHFAISLKGGYKFNYAVDASWAYPTKTPPVPPDDFPLGANQYEPYWLEVDEWVNTLWHDGTSCGGNVFYRITAHDWQGSSTIGGGFIEIPNLNIENALNDITEVGDNYVTWEFNAYDPDIECSGPADVLISVYSPQGDYQPKLTGVSRFLRSYTLHITDVLDYEPALVPPVAIASAETPTGIAKHETVTFYGGDSYDPDGTELTFGWDFNGDGEYGDEYMSGTDKHPTAVFHAGGIFEVDLRVTDGDYLHGYLEEKITVTVSNEPPTAHAEMSGSEPYYAGALYTFDATGSTDVDGEVSTYVWDFDYDGVTFDEDDYGAVVKHAFDLSTYDIMLCVYDDDGAYDFLDEPITRTFIYKENFPPEITGVEFDRTTALKDSYDERVTLTVYFTDPDAMDEHTVEWIAAGGEFNVVDNQQFQQTAEWTAIDEVGHFTITVRVTDLFGDYDEDDSTMIRVTQFPTGNDPYGYNVSKPAPGWSLVAIPDDTQTFHFADYSPGNVVYIHFFRTN